MTPSTLIVCWFVTLSFFFFHPAASEHDARVEHVNQHVGSWSFSLLRFKYNDFEHNFSYLNSQLALQFLTSSTSCIQFPLCFRCQCPCVQPSFLISRWVRSQFFFLSLFFRIEEPFANLFIFNDCLHCPQGHSGRGACSIFPWEKRRFTPEQRVHRKATWSRTTMCFMQLNMAFVINK